MVHARLITEVLAGRAISEEDALLWMVVLATQKIVLRAPVDGVREYSGLTWRSAAEVIAELWRGKKHGAEHRYADYIGPYSDYTRALSANAIADVGEPAQTRVRELRDLLRTHPWLESVEDD